MNSDVFSKPAAVVADETKGLLASLLDLSFATAITPKIIKWLYLASIIMAGLGVLGWIGASWRSHSIFTFPVTLVFAPLLFVFYVVSARVALEVVMVIFQIADSLKKIEQNGK